MRLMSFKLKLQYEKYDEQYPEKVSINLEQLVFCLKWNTIETIAAHTKTNRPIFTENHLLLKDAVSCFCSDCSIDRDILLCSKTAPEDSKRKMVSESIVLQFYSFLWPTFISSFIRSSTLFSAFINYIILVCWETFLMLKCIPFFGFVPISFSILFNSKCVPIRCIDRDPNYSLLEYFIDDKI